ncbi:rhodanese-like domain-containing protein [Saccharopolyspora sp. WRP15-2]|uniref:Rhodanese-like domain-containing protein n=1 Tax=Saccharopolyspora oryzae TaxID=2997343 RepID=A0ABT4V7K3_9PSEU|nr:rhodanese-like domain-containing protein [Saccharopolyspora oryzae]MDA3629962.1 rhodanese-like domain-containing protein [Saccharopolyspora oryzae]
MTDSSSIDVAAARKLVATTPGTRLIDVRTPGEFAAAHIPGSRSVPLDLLRAKSGLTVDHSDPVVLVCRSGARAEEARGLLATAGIDRLVVLEGGIEAWERTGAPVKRGAGKWAMERQVRLTAGSLVLTGILGSLVAPKMKWLAGAIGAGLTYSALSNTCAMARVLSMLPYNRTPEQDGPALLEALTSSAQR